MSYHFSKHILQRIPLFPVNRYEQPLSETLLDPVFQAALYLASPQFYARLSKAGFDIKKMNGREINSATRYLNRACFRSTPFGYFASVNAGVWESGGRIHLRESADELRSFIQPAELVSQSLFRQGDAESSENSYEPNPTLYRVKKYFRFIREESGNNYKRSYQLQSTLYAVILNALLKYCKNGQSSNLIIERICRDARCTQEEGVEYFEFLKDAQILLQKQRATITGQVQDLLDHKSLTMNMAISNIDPAYELKNQSLLLAPSLQLLDKQLRTLIAEPAEEKSLLNTILVRNTVFNSVDISYQADLKQGLFALDKLCPEDQLPALKEFNGKFRKHFEGERIPLLLALDPELSIGYQAEPLESPNPLLETVNIRPRGGQLQTASWTEAHRCLMAAWIKMESRNDTVIFLEEKELKRLPGSQPSITGLGSSVLFNISEDGLFIESAGGCNPLALVGRFTLADPSISRVGKDIARQIENLNPDLIFAEILHLADPHIDNVNRREQLWTYQLPILAASIPGTETIRLDDLYVELAGSVALIWSKKHQKYVVPRLTSAYNHSIDQLPLFRFLADLSYQCGRTQLSFDLSHYFPGFSYYPRVMYQGVILSVATWIISPDELMELQNESDGTEAFMKLAERHRLPKKFIVSEGDQQLVFDQLKEADLRLFRETIRTHRQTVIREYLPQKSKEAVTGSETGNQYHVQFNAFMMPEEPLHLPAPHFVATEHHQQRKFIPGTEWLYLKLYVPRLAVNRLLLRLQTVINKKFIHGRISRWFFIRYEDHAPHIRLRLNIDPLDIDAILAALRLVLEDNVQQHLIREYQLDVYSRELERYQAAGIEATEEFFWYSSAFVVQFLKTRKSGNSIPSFQAAAFTIKVITEDFYSTAEQQLEFWQNAFENYFTEFEGKNLKVELDHKYRVHSQALDVFLQAPEPFPQKQLQHWLKKMRLKAIEINKKLDNNESKRDYLLSLIHVHLNRMFADQQREQEMVIYFLLFKWMRSRIARQKKGI